MVWGSLPLYHILAGARRAGAGGLVERTESATDAHRRGPGHHSFWVIRTVKPSCEKWRSLVSASSMEAARITFIEMQSVRL